MNHPRIGVASTLCHLLIALLLIPGNAVPADQMGGRALVETLRQGGYHVYFRHAQTDWSQSDRIEKEGDWTSCDPTRVRQLSEAGRQTARDVGRAIRSLGIPVGRVLASPYCRTVDTAKLMDLGPVETTTDVMNMRSASYVGGREAVIDRARTLLGSRPPEGKNTIIAAHGNVARAATPVYPGEAEGLVFRPDGNGDFVFVGRLMPEQWRRLADEMAH